MATHEIKADLDVDGEVQGTSLDINGNADISGTLALATLDISGNADIDGTTNLDAVDIDGVVQIDNTLTVGVDDTGYDVKFFGATSGSSFLYDQSEDGVVITHPTNEIGLGIYTISGSQPTVPQLQIGRSTSQYWGVYTDDRTARLIHRQDETSGALSTYFEQWDSNTSDTTGNWLWRFGDGSGGNMATALTLTQGGDLTLVGDIYHSGDSDTKIGFSAANTFQVQTGGSARLTVNDSTAAFIGNISVSGTVDGVDIATRDGILSGTTITAQAALPKTGGTMSGAIAMGSQNITGGGTITGTTLTGTSLDINGNADISGNLTGLDNVTSTNFIIGGHTINDIDVTSEDSNADDHLMTAKAIVNLIADNENSFLTSSSNTSGTAAIATTITVADESSDTSCNVLFTTAATGNLGPKSGTNLTFNSSSGVLTATGFAGALTGNVTGNASGSSGSCTGNAATATLAATSTIASDTGSATHFPVFVDGSTGSRALKAHSSWNYNPGTSTLTAGKLTTDVAAIVENNKDGGALMTLTGQGAGNEANICLKMVGTEDGNPIKMKMTALDDSGSGVGAGILSYDAEDDSFGIGQNSSHNRMAIKMENTITSPVDGSTYVYYEPTSIKAREYIITSNSSHYDFYGDIMRNGNDTTVRGKMYCFKNGTWTITNADTKLDANGLLGMALGTNSTTHGMLLKGTFTLDYDPGGIGNPLYISTTDGLVSTTVPSTSGHIVRLVGYLVGGAHGNLWFNPDSTYVEVA